MQWVGVLPRLRAEWRRDFGSVEQRLTQQQEKATKREKVQRAALRELTRQAQHTFRDVRRLKDKHHGWSSKLADARAEVRRLEAEVARLNARVRMDERLGRKWDARLDTVLDPARVAAHVRHALEDAPLQTAPFPHLIVPQWLPDDLHELLADCLPSADGFPATDGAVREMGPSQTALLPPAAGAAWRFFDTEVAPVGGAIADARLGSAAAERFALLLGPTLGAQIEKLPRVTSGRRLTLHTRVDPLGPRVGPKHATATLVCTLAGASTYRLFQLTNPLPDWLGGGIFRPTREGVDCVETVRVVLKANTLLVVSSVGGAVEHSPADDGDAAGDGLYCYEWTVGPAIPRLLRALEGLPPERQQSWLDLVLDDEYFPERMASR